MNEDQLNHLQDELHKFLQNKTDTERERLDLEHQFNENQSTHDHLEEKIHIHNLIRRIEQLMGMKTNRQNEYHNNDFHLVVGTSNVLVLFLIYIYV